MFNSFKRHLICLFKTNGKNGWIDVKYELMIINGCVVCVRGNLNIGALVVSKIKMYYT